MNTLWHTHVMWYFLYSTCGTRSNLPENLFQLLNPGFRVTNLGNYLRICSETLVLGSPPWGLPEDLLWNLGFGQQTLVITWGFVLKPGFWVANLGDYLRICYETLVLGNHPPSLGITWGFVLKPDFWANQSWGLPEDLFWNLPWGLIIWGCVLNIGFRVTILGDYLRIFLET